MLMDVQQRAHPLEWVQPLHHCSIMDAFLPSLRQLSKPSCFHVDCRPSVSADASQARMQVRDRIAGRKRLPWEEPEAVANGHRQLRILKHTVLACLSRDPVNRPTAQRLLRSWNRIFDTFSTGSGGVGTTTNVLAGRQ
jgi:hypothetical protein